MVGMKCSLSICRGSHCLRYLVLRITIHPSVIKRSVMDRYRGCIVLVVKGRSALHARQGSSIVKVVHLTHKPGFHRYPHKPIQQMSDSLHYYTVIRIGVQRACNTHVRISHG